MGTAHVLAYILWGAFLRPWFSDLCDIVSLDFVIKKFWHTAIVAIFALKKRG